MNIAATEIKSGWYSDAIGQLVHVVQDLSYARDMDTVMAIVRKAARDLTGADGATFVLRDGDFCFYADENAISPLWKGQRFPLKICISGWVMLNAQQVVIEDIYKDSRIPAEAYRPTFVKSLAMVPIRKNQPIGAIGNYWATNRKPSAEEMAILQALADVTSVTLENVDLYGRLQQKIKALEVSNNELNRFAWVASHDLKSPLRAIDNLAKWTEEDIGNKDFDKGSANLSRLRSRVQRMEKLLDDVLEYSRMEHKMGQDSGEIVTGPELIRDVLALVNIPEGFKVTVDEGFESLSLYRMPLQQVLCNIINNGIIHHDRKTGNIHVGVIEEETRYIFTVTDDGPGIDPQYYQKIFEMFQTLKPRDSREGSGMGLAFVKKIMDIYGATITVEQPGVRGSVFRFTWPKKLILKGT